MNTELKAMFARCKLHAARLAWAKSQLAFPLDTEKLNHLNNVQLAILDQFSTRFAKLQDYIDTQLFPVILELVKKPTEQQPFIDKLHRLEKIAAIPSANQWLLQREMRNQFAHEYPDDPELQAATLNKAAQMTDDLINTLSHIETFAAKYTNIDE
jgi:hypothetical protein